MNVNFHISKYTVLMIIVSLLFVFAVIKAFTYLPEDQNDSLLLQNAKNKVTNVSTQNSENEVATEENTSEEEQDDDDTSESETQVSDVDRLIEKANYYRENGEEQRAIMTYLEVVNITDSPQKYAICYDGISKIYAEQQNYEKAIQKAELAYKYNPNNTRRLTLAKLYRKIGDTEKEQNLLNEIMDN